MNMKLLCKDGARQLLETINKSCNTKKDFHHVVNPVIQRSGYFRNHENLLSLTTDAQPDIRELDVHHITKTRKQLSVSKAPTMNFEVIDYITLSLTGARNQ